MISTASLSSKMMKPTLEVLPLIKDHLIERDKHLTRRQLMRQSNNTKVKTSRLPRTNSRQVPLVPIISEMDPARVMPHHKDPTDKDLVVPEASHRTILIWAGDDHIIFLCRLPSNYF